MHVLLNVCVQGNVLNVSLRESNGFLFQLVSEAFTDLVLHPPPMSVVLVDVLSCQFFTAEVVRFFHTRTLRSWYHGPFGGTGPVLRFWSGVMVRLAGDLVMYVLELFILQLQLSFGFDVDRYSSSSSTWTGFFSSTQAPLAALRSREMAMAYGGRRRWPGCTLCSSCFCCRPRVPSFQLLREGHRGSTCTARPVL